MLAFSGAACGAGRRIPRSKTQLSASPPYREITARSASIPGDPLPPSMQPKDQECRGGRISTALGGKSAYPVRQTCWARGQAASSVIIFSHRLRCSDITCCRGRSTRRRPRLAIEGYDAADPRLASTLALRDEWMAPDDGEHGRLAEGYGALIEYLSSECRRHGAALHLGAAVAAIDETGGRITVGCRDGATFEADAAILTVPLPLLSKIALPSAAHERVAATADIGFGNVTKILLRFTTKWWADHGGRDLADLSFLLSDATVPTWWTQHPDEYPVLTGWLAGPKADSVSSLSETELINMGLASLAEIFDLPLDRIRRHLVASRAINWGNDRFARGAYSYATPKTRQAQSLLRKSNGDAILFSGEALYAGPDMGTVEAALASGQETAQTILTGCPGTSPRRGKVPHSPSLS